MAFMKKDVNFFLFILVVATLIIFAGFTTFYQTTIKNISTEYSTRISELDDVTTKLTTEKEKLDQTTQQLKVKAEREKDLSGRYETIRGLKEQLEKDKATLESELSKTKSELGQKKAELDSAQNELAEKLILVNSLYSEVDSLKDQRTALNAEISCLLSQPDDQEANC